MRSGNTINLVLLLLSLVGGQAYAQEATSCAPLSSPKDVIKCALENHPELKRSRLSLDQANELEAVAGQRPNPELEGNVLVGKFLGDEIQTSGASLMIPIEIGGKRGSRINKATAEREMSSATFQKAREDALIEITTRLIRLRQLEVESHLIEEALTTFGRIQKQYRSRPRLGPEQEVSLSVFQLAEADYRMKTASLKSDLDNTTRSMAVTLGSSAFEPKAALLPSARTSWPEIPELKDEQTDAITKGSSMKFALSQLGAAQAELSLAQADSWPNLKIGPSIENEREGPLNQISYGIGISFDLPIFTLNGGGRAYAHRGLTLAEESLALRRKEVSAERQSLVNRYRAAVKALQEAPSHAELERKHRSVEGFFSRGVISASLVIEVHRQMVDFAKSQHEMEIEATEALYRIRALEGQLTEENL